MRTAVSILISILLFTGDALGQSTSEPVSVPSDRETKPAKREPRDARSRDMRQAPIRSMADLSRYLDEHASSPFDAFSDRARELFVESLTFNEVGLTGFRTAEVESELTPQQAHAVLALFGVQGTVPSLQFESRTEERTEGFQHASADDILGELADRVRTLDRDIDNLSLKLTRMQGVFANVLEAVDRASIGNLSDTDVKDFFEITMLLASYSNEPTYVSQMRRAFDELEKRKFSTRQQAHRMRDQYIAARMILDATEFASARPNLGLKKSPRFVESASPQARPWLWRLSADGSTLENHAFQVDPDTAVVVVASPWCSFSRAASVAVANDRELSPLMARNSTWILAQISVRDFDDIREWNETFPGQPLQMVDRNADWPDLELLKTPIFYFYRGGEIVTTVSGWPGPEQLEKLRAGFSSLGLSDSRPVDSGK